MAELLNSETRPKEKPAAHDQMSQPTAEDSERPVRALQNFVGFGSEMNSSGGRTPSTGASAAQTSVGKAPTSDAHLVAAHATAVRNQNWVTDPQSANSVKAVSVGAKRAAPAAKPVTYSEG